MKPALGLWTSASWRRHETEIETQDGQLGIRPVAVVRQGWEEAFGGMAMASDDHLLDPEPLVLTKWETHEWEWQ